MNGIVRNGIQKIKILFKQIICMSYLFLVIGFMTKRMIAEIVIPPAVGGIHELAGDNARHVSIYPYISGDTFRSIAKFTVDETRSPLNTHDIKSGDIIFVRSTMLGYFFASVHPYIPCKYILISHNEDDSSPGPFVKMLDDDKIIAWFALNADIKDHTKLVPIPLGFANSYWPHGDISAISAAMQKVPTIKKDKLLYVNFTAGDDFRQHRSAIKEHFNDKPFVYKATFKPWHEYMQDLAESKFVLSPRGKGLDCHRTWEALLMGAIPIVQPSTLDPLYEDLPVLIVTEWNEITGEFLNQKYEEMSAKKYNREKMYVGWWLDLIKKRQQAYLKTLAAS